MSAHLFYALRGAPEFCALRLKSKIRNPKSKIQLVLGTGLEPARLAATASKTVVYAIPPPERVTTYKRTRCLQN
jgi:hypothetical protein